MTLSLWQALYALCGYWGLLALTPLYLFALLRGDATAKALAHVLAIGALLGTFLATETAMQATSLRFGNSQLSLNMLLLTAQIVLTLRSRWLYPIAIAAMQLLIALADAVGAAGLVGHPGTMFWLIVPPGMIQLAVFTHGLIAHRNRLPRKGKMREFGQTA